MIYLFLLSRDSYFRRIVAPGIQPVSDPTSNIASLCVFYNALCWWMCRGISGRSVSGAEGHTMWDIQSLCEHCAFSISGSCVTGTMKNVEKWWGEGEDGSGSRFGREEDKVRVFVIDHASSRSIVFSEILHSQRACQNVNRTSYTINFAEWTKVERKETWTYAWQYISIDK